MLELLREVASITLDDIAFEFGLKPVEAEIILRKLRKQGLARITTHNPRRWAWDGDFVCQSCGRGVPDVRRGSGCSRYCGHCYHRTYLRASRPGPVPVGSTRFSHDECGTWDGALSQKYLGKKL